MKLTLLYIFIAIIAIGSFYSCKNKLEVFSPGDESVSVYGILNPNVTTQNIRINKVFLTDGDALVAGQDANQINYGPGELEVTLERFLTGTTTSTLTTVGNATKKKITLTETVITTQSGTFSQEQRIWQTTDKLYNSGDYKLNIKNIKTGKEWSAQTSVFDSIKSGVVPLRYSNNITQPWYGYPMHGHYVKDNPPGAGTPSSNYIHFEDVNMTHTIKFKSVKNAKIYKVVLRFHYHDLLNSTYSYTTSASTATITGHDTIPQYIDYEFASVKSPTTNGDEELTFALPHADFYSTVALELSKKTDVPNFYGRKGVYMEYKIYCGADNLNDFLSVNAPSNTIAQDKPNYSNIVGGVGIFSSATISIYTKDLWSAFIDKLSCYSVTKPYHITRIDETFCP